MAKLSALKGGKVGPHGAATPAVLSAQAAKRAVTFILPLGTGAVSTATHALGHMPVAGKVVAIYISGSAAVTGTSITLDVGKAASDGSSSTTLLASAQDIKLTGSTDLTVLSQTLTATTANLTVTAGTLFTATATATSITAGPGNVGITIVYVPSEDTANAAGLVTTGADL